MTGEQAYLDAVKDLLSDASRVIRITAEVAAIGGIPPKEYLVMCSDRIHPAWRHLAFRDLQIPVTDQIETICKAEMKPVAIHGIVHWTAGTAAVAVVSHLIEEIPPQTFDAPQFPIGRASLQNTLQEASEHTAELVIRVEMEVAKTRLRFDQSLRTPRSEVEWEAAETMPGDMDFQAMPLRRDADRLILQALSGGAQQSMRLLSLTGQPIDIISRRLSILREFGLITRAQASVGVVEEITDRGRACLKWLQQP